jgi:hypothetical protein
MKSSRYALILTLCAALAASGCASMQSVTPDAYQRSTAETVVRGHQPAGRKPVLTVKSGQVVRIDTVSHHGITGVEHDWARSPRNQMTYLSAHCGPKLR